MAAKKKQNKPKLIVNLLDDELKDIVNVYKFKDALHEIYLVSRGELKHGENTIDSLTNALEIVRTLSCAAYFGDE